MASRSEAPDPAVDELRRKARRRLVGAAVLALAAAVALPLLLENEPKPLGDDVSIQIPPVDSGKFVNPLSPAPPDTKGKEDKPSPPAANVPPPAAADTSARPDSAKAEPSKSEPAKSEPAKTEPAKTEPAKSESGGGPVKAEPARKESSTGGARDNTTPAMAPKSSENAAAAPQIANVAPSSESRTDNKAPVADAKSGAPKTQGGFVVQVAAFSDRYGARSLVAKLKKVGFPGYTETVETDKGTLHRVRVGPYPSREVADAARAKLKAAGYSGVVARSG
jgi:DedD protein